MKMLRLPFSFDYTKSYLHNKLRVLRELNIQIEWHAGLLEINLLTIKFKISFVVFKSSNTI